MRNIRNGRSKIEVISKKTFKKKFSVESIMSDGGDHN